MKKILIFIVVFILLLIFSYSGNKFYKQSQWSKEDNITFQNFIKNCGSIPYVSIIHYDGIEGVQLENYYYPPSHKNYNKAREKAVSSGHNGNYKITYSCTENIAASNKARLAP